MNNGIEPINNDPFGPGIGAANILFLLPLNLSNITVTTNMVDSIVNTNDHIFSSLVHINSGETWLKNVAKK